MFDYTNQYGRPYLIVLSSQTKGYDKLLSEHKVTFLAILSFLTSLFMKLPL